MTAFRDEVSRFFDDFVTAFCSFSGVSIAALYHVPGVALRGDGSIQCLQSRADIERFFQAAIDAYHRDGCRGIRFKDLDVMPIGGRSALGTVSWELLREDGAVLRQWRQSYNLVRVERGWQVFASTYHVG
ncbi:MAG: hypothetical protein ABW216_16130 [Candidatus Rokuibacteriota bacterium]